MVELKVTYSEDGKYISGQYLPNLSSATFIVKKMLEVLEYKLEELRIENIKAGKI